MRKVKLGIPFVTRNHKQDACMLLLPSMRKLGIYLCEKSKKTCICGTA